MPNNKIDLDLVIGVAGFSESEELLELQKKAFQTVAEFYNDFSILPLVENIDSYKQNFDEYICIKASDGQKIIGSVRGKVSGDTCHIGRLVVLAEYRKLGIGKKLMDALESELSNVSRFELFTGIENKNTVRFYENLGYRHFDIKKENDNIQLTYMEKFK